MSFADCDSCPEFSGWQLLRMKVIVADFRRLLSLNSGFSDLTTYLIDVSEFEERTVLNGQNAILSETYQRLQDGCSIVIQSIKV
jgi:hypothetical protein